jgi:dTDP-4-dehydrorhamnose reductase
VIHKDDIVKIVSSFIKEDISNKTINIANSYKYSIYEIIECIESKLNRVARYSTIDMSDNYDLNFDFMNSFIKKNSINISFGREYLCNKLKSL